VNVEITVPPVGESVVEATIGNLLQPSGSIVKQDAELLELETDKVNQVVYAPVAGKVQFNVSVGDRVTVGQVIGTIDTTAAGATAHVPEKAPTTSPKASPPPTPLPPKASLPGARKMPDEFLAETSQTPKPPAPVAPPVEKPVERPVERQVSPQSSSSADGRISRKKMTKLRRVIAQKLVEVKNQTAMLTTFNEVDMSTVMAVREKEQENFQKRYGVKLGFMSFFIKAAVAALQQYPDINGRIEGDEIVYNNFFDIGVAVSTEKGLMVPVLRNVDKMSYADIEKALKMFAEKARQGMISIDDLQGGTFTITNGGVFGSLLSTPILNPPQSGILGMHNIVKRPIAVDDKVEIRPMMYLALSYDHRIVDGKESIGFLVHLKKNLEEPARLLLDL
jgi:2-oxoglutarate dehydrogenase E2 component (dihydrolipoamide succinyltransferase)